MPVKEGDFLLVNYTLKVKESGETVEPTLDTVAKEARIHREDNVYQPKFVVIGEELLPKGLEELLVGTELGTKKTIELTPEKGYGARDPGKMRLVSLRRFREKGIDPVPGAQVELEGRPAVTKDKFDITHDESDLTIEVPEEAFYLSGLQVAKKSITADLQKYFPRLNTIAFREIYKRGTPETKAEVSEPAAEPKPEHANAKAEPKTAAKKSDRAAPKKSTGRKSSGTTSKRRPQKSKTGTEEETE